MMGTRCLADHIANAATEHDAADNLKLSKKLSTERIDGASALVSAIDQWSRTSHVPAAAV